MNEHISWNSIKTTETHSLYWNHLERLISFKTVSAQPDEKQFRDCTDYLDELLEPLGFSGSWQTNGGLPIGIFTKQLAQARPWSVLYQHYDVSPAGELRDWTSDPFAAKIRNSRIFGRGAQDNKGQLCYLLAALHDLTKQAEIENNVLLILDGEEEIGSPSLLSVLRSLDIGQVDQVWSFDGICPNERQVSFVLGCRGFSALKVHIQTAERPAHSGYYGGIAVNAATVLTQLLATLKKEDRPSVDCSFASACHLRAPQDLLAESGLFSLTEDSPERIFEHMALKECLEITSLSSGSSGSSLTIPSEASATLVLRPAPGMEAEARVAELSKRIRALSPPWSLCNIEQIGGVVTGFMNQDPSSVRHMAQKALRSNPHLVPSFTVDGGCSAGLSQLSVISLAPSCITGSGQAQDRIHCSNESFSFEQFTLGYSIAQNILRASS